ncbi:MAG TPA: EF-hand domain-containing protein [Desulfobulbus sp.]|nr:EF-hand domain-containing protein [Desulfobulbus sp.]
MKKIIPAALLTLVATAALAMAPSFAQVDTNKDGAISQSEAEAVGISKELFTKADADHNGTLNMDEFKNLTVQGK